MYSRTCLCCHYDILKSNVLLQNRHSFFVQNPWNFLDIRICVYKLSKQKPCHRTINHLPCNLRMARKGAFSFIEIVEVRSSVSNCEIYLPLFSFKILSEVVVTRKKIGCQLFLPGCLSAFKTFIIIIFFWSS